VSQNNATKKLNKTAFRRLIDYLTLTLPFLTFGVDVTRRQTSSAKATMGPLRLPDKPEAKEISWKLWQASGVTANVCYLALYNPYGTDLKE